MAFSDKLGPAECGSQQEIELHRIVDLTPQMLAVMEPDGYISWVNETALDYLGISLGDLSADDLRARVYHPDDLQRFGEDRRRALAQGVPFETEQRLRGKDGTYRCFLIRYRPLKDAERRVLRWYGGATDIEDRKRAEDALRRSEAYLAEAQRLTHTGSWTCRPGSTKPVYWSGEMYRTWGFDPQQEPPDVQALLQRVHPEDHERISKLLERAFAGHPAVDVEADHRIVLPDGTVKFVHETCYPVFDEAGQVVEYLGTAVDVTESKRVEDALRRGEEELRHVIETIPTLVWTALPDGSNASVNRRWVDYSGMSPEQTTGSGWHDAIHPEDRERYLKVSSECFKSGRSLEDEVRFRRADGEYRWFLVTGVPLRDESGNILKWFGIATDVDDRKRAEALFGGEKRILEMVAKGDSLAQILDSLCRLVEQQASGVLASIFLVVGNRLQHGAAPSLPKAYTDAIEGIVIGPSAGFCGTAAYRGEQVVVEDIATDPLWADYRELALPHSLRACLATPVVSSQDKVIATFAMYYREPRSLTPRDQEIIEQITHLAGVAIERKLTQDGLRRSEAYLADAQRLSHTGSWAVDPNTRETLYLSDELIRMCGFDPQDGLPTREQLFERIHPEDRDRVKKISDKVSREKTDLDYEYRMVLPDGTVKHIHATARVVLNATGEFVEMMGTSVDVTERKRAEAELERLHRLEADLARMNRVTTLGELTASLADQIKQPIAAAMTNANTSVRWLANKIPDIDEAREAAKRAAKDANRAAEIVNRIQSLFRNGEVQREWVDVNDIIDDIVVLLGNEAMRYDVSIKRELSTDLPHVMADRVQLQQVLMNLIANSIDAMRGVDGTRELTLVSQRDGSGQVLVSVSDNGVGLPPDMGQIFNAFFTTKPHGTGMGLAISRTIIEAHGGRLWASSNSGRGATFHFTLPTTIEAPL